MTDDGDEIAVPTLLHARGWIVVPVRVGAIFELQFVLNTGFLSTAISARTRTVLSAMGHVGETRGRPHVLRNLTLAGRPIPDLPVRISPALSLLGVEGALGLDFLRQFRDVHFNLPSRRLTLRR